MGVVEVDVELLRYRVGVANDSRLEGVVEIDGSSEG